MNVSSGMEKAKNQEHTIEVAIDKVGMGNPDHKHQGLVSMEPLHTMVSAATALGWDQVKKGPNRRIQHPLPKRWELILPNI